MSERKRLILAALDQSRQEVNSILDQLQPADWEIQIQDEDQLWTARQMLLHMVTAQRGMTGNITNLSKGQDAVPPDFDLNRYNNRSIEKGADKSVQELRTSLDEGRVALKQVISDLQESDFDIRGRHGSGEILSIEGFARLVGTHEAEHAHIIATKLKIHQP